MDGRAAEVAALDQPPHPPRGVCELSVVPRRELQAPAGGKLNQSACFVCVQRERLLNVDVTAILEAQAGELEVGGGRRRDV